MQCGVCAGTVAAIPSAPSLYIAPAAVTQLGPITTGTPQQLPDLVTTVKKPCTWCVLAILLLIALVAKASD